MPSLLKLKGTMLLTFVLIFGVLFFFLSIVAYFFEFQLYGVLVFTIIFLLIQWYAGPKIIQWSTKMKVLKEGENPFLESIVFDLTSGADIPKPRIAIVPNPVPNAFVFGRTRKSSILAVHEGLLNKLDKGELRAVIAHEIGHLKHNDCMVMTAVSAVPLVAYMVSRSLFFPRRGRNAGAMILVGIFALVIYFISQLLVMFLSRSREYYADAYSAVTTRQPSKLMSALTKITLGLSTVTKDPGPVRAFYINDPFSSRREIAAIASRASEYDLNRDGVLDETEIQAAMEKESKKKGFNILELLSTHPHTFKRLAALKHIEMDLQTGKIKTGMV